MGDPTQVDPPATSEAAATPLRGGDPTQVDHRAPSEGGPGRRGFGGRRSTRVGSVPWRAPRRSSERSTTRATPQAIASSAPRENLRVILDEFSLRPYFRAIVSADDITRGKPDPEIFLRAAEVLGETPDHCAVLEDAVVGVQAGKRASMKIYAVATTRRREDLQEADRIADTLVVLAPTDFIIS